MRVLGVKESIEEDEIQLRNQKKREIKRGKQKLNVRERKERIHAIFCDRFIYCCQSLSRRGAVESMGVDVAHEP